MLAVMISAALAGSLHGSVSAAGLGRLTVQSALGQPLQAQVEVTSLMREELDSLSARLAPIEAFRQAGIEPNPALSSLRFAIDRQPDGRAYVRISSGQPINEPFVDLLVELNWASGRFIREYTFLLDPPELRIGRETVEGNTVLSQVTAPAASAPVPARNASARGAAAGGEAGRNSRSTAQAQQATSPRASSGASAAPASAAAPARAAVSPAPSAETVTVQRGDTLAGIASRVKPTDIAVEQAVVAIYNANPSAFFGTVHQMHSGRTLAIPDRAAMAAIDAADARRQIRVQAGDFNAYRQRLAATVRKVDSADAGTSASGAVTARVDETAGPAAAGDQLKLSRGNDAGASASATAGTATGSASGQSAAEAGVATNVALREQEERVALLEKNLADLQRLLELKNRQLAELQRQVEASLQGKYSASGALGQPATADASPATASPAGSGAAATSGTSPGAAASPASAQASGAGSDTASTSSSPGSSAASGASPSGNAAAASPSTPGSATSEASQAAAAGSAGTSGAANPSAAQNPSQADASPTSSSPTGASASSPDTPSAPAASSSVAQPAAPATARPASARPAAAPEPSFIDELLANPLTVPGLGALAIALGAYGWYTMRRRRKADSFEDSLIAADAFTANSLFGTTGGQAVDTSNQSMFGPSVRDTSVDVHSTEVDPIAEAEVYIAYGREAQAEEILREALKRQPERQAIRLKLLEICAGRKDAAAFRLLAQQMYDLSGGQNEEWPKVATMGLALDPDNPLYAGGGEPGAIAGFDEAELEPTGVGDGDAEAAEQAMQGGAQAVQQFDAFYAGGDSSDAQELGTPAPRPAHDDAGEGGSRSRDFAQTQAMREPQASDEAPSLDFSLDVDTSVGPIDDPAQDGAAARTEGGEGEPSELERAIGGRFDLPSLDFAAPAGGPVVPGQAAQPKRSAAGEAPAFAELGDFRIDLPALEDLDVKGKRPALDLGDTALDLGDTALDLASLDVVPPGGGSAQWQEMATKLDLASAYEEIGDKDGARELLDEVVRGGDSDQKRKAEAMLAKIG